MPKKHESSKNKRRSSSSSLSSDSHSSSSSSSSSHSSPRSSPPSSHSSLSSGEKKYRDKKDKKKYTRSVDSEEIVAKPKNPRKKKAKSGYDLFCLEQRPKIKIDHAEWRLPQIASELGKRWKALEQRERDTFNQVALKMRQNV